MMHSLPTGSGISRAIYRLARSSVYAAAPAPVPKTRVSDGDLVEEIRAVLAACPFHAKAIARCALASPIAAERSVASACSG